MMRDLFFKYGSYGSTSTNATGNSRFKGLPVVGITGTTTIRGKRAGGSVFKKKKKTQRSLCSSFQHFH